MNRSKLQDDLHEKMVSKGLTGELYDSKLSEYMDLYDYCQRLQKSAAEVAGRLDRCRLYLDIIKEIRQINKSMRDILTWLGITPDADIQEDYQL